MASSRSASRISSSSPRRLGPPAGRQTQEKPHVDRVRMVPDQGPQDRQGLGKTFTFDQRPRGIDARIGGQVRLGLARPEPGHQTRALDAAGADASGGAAGGRRNNIATRSPHTLPAASIRREKRSGSYPAEYLARSPQPRMRSRISRQRGMEQDQEDERGKSLQAWHGQKRRAAAWWLPFLTVNNTVRYASYDDDLLRCAECTDHMPVCPPGLKWPLNSPATPVGWLVSASFTSVLPASVAIVSRIQRAWPLQFPPSRPAGRAR